MNVPYHISTIPVTPSVSGKNPPYLHNFRTFALTSRFAEPIASLSHQPCRSVRNMDWDTGFSPFFSNRTSPHWFLPFSSEELTQFLLRKRVVNAIWIIIEVTPDFWFFNESAGSGTENLNFELWIFDDTFLFFERRSVIDHRNIWNIPPATRGFPIANEMFTTPVPIIKISTKNPLYRIPCPRRFLQILTLGPLIPCSYPTANKLPQPTGRTQNLILLPSLLPLLLLSLGKMKKRETAICRPYEGSTSAWRYPHGQSCPYRRLCAR